jgi:Spy/CpxP family protein refolding chaperone
MSYGSVPQENWDAIFEEPQNTALKQAERAYAQEDPITATDKPKRVLTPEQKAAAAERMAKARAARKPKVEPAVQADEPAQAVPAEEV